MNVTNILEVFEYNQHFVAMMNIINAARLNPPESGHKHHIIPRCWFKMNKGKQCPRSIAEFNKSCKGAHWKLVNGKRVWYGLQ